MNFYDNPDNPHHRSKPALRSHEALSYCHAHNIPFVAYGTLGGTYMRQGKLKNLSESFPQAKAMAVRKGVSTAVLLLAYLKHRYPQIIHIPGGRAVEHVRDNQKALGVRFTAQEMDVLSRMKPTRGPR